MLLLPFNPRNLAKVLLDEQYMKTPFYGSRNMTVYLNTLGYEVNRKRVIRLMNQLGIQAIYPKKRTTVRNPEHQIYPYLLRDLTIEKANQVWCTDITYLPIGKGHFYLVAIMDWFSRKVLSGRISNTMDIYFCKRGRKHWRKHCQFMVNQTYLIVIKEANLPRRNLQDV